MTKSGSERRDNESMLYVVSYDVPDDRRRARIHSALTSFGTWVQYSVFECFLDRKQRLLLEARLLKEIHQQEDTVRIYGLCGTCVSHAMRNELVEELIVEREEKVPQNRTGSPEDPAKPAKEKAKQAAERQK